jgi:hypothetical protein
VTDKLTRFRYKCIYKNGAFCLALFKYVYKIAVSVRCLKDKPPNSLTHPWSWALLEKPPIVQLLKNLPTFYGTPKVHYRVHKSPPLVPILSQSIPSHPTYVLVFLMVYFLLALPPISYMHSSKRPKREKNKYIFYFLIRYHNFIFWDSSNGTSSAYLKCLTQ